MDTTVLIFSIFAVTMACVTFQAWRLGNETRDVALLGGVGGLCGVGAAIAAVV